MPRVSKKEKKVAHKKVQYIEVEKKHVKKQARPYKGFFKEAGGKLGSYFGQTGKHIGNAAGSVLGKVLGFGDYSIDIKKNTLLSGQVPMMHSLKDGFRISHREYIGDVVGSTAFSSTSYPVNPGWSATFPWLNQIAESFQEYCIDGMIFEFKSTCCDALSSTNNAMGTVVMSCDYNTANAAFTTKLQQEQSLFCVSGKPSLNIMLPVECDPKQTPLPKLYVRNAAISSSQNIQFYDLANMQISTVGMQAATTIGELWITYDICFYKSISLNLPNGSEVLDAHYAASAATWTDVLPLKGVVSKYDNIGTGMAITGRTITFPSNVTNGYYNIQIIWQNVSAAGTYSTPSITSLVGCSYQTIYAGATSGAAGAPLLGGATDLSVIVLIQVQITAASAVITIGTDGGLPTNASSYLDVMVFQTNPLVI